MPDADLCLGGVVLHKGMVTHELHSAVAVVPLVLCGVALPHTDGWLSVDDHAVQKAEVKEVHPDPLCGWFLCNSFDQDQCAFGSLEEFLRLILPP